MNNFDVNKYIGKSITYTEILLIESHIDSKYINKLTYENNESKERVLSKLKLINSIISDVLELLRGIDNQYIIDALYIDRIIFKVNEGYSLTPDALEFLNTIYLKFTYIKSSIG
jgi:hypothetical protein